MSTSMSLNGRRTGPARCAAGDAGSWKVVGWLHRYGPSEVLGTAVALLALTGAGRLTGQAVAAAYAAAIAECLVYYGVHFRRELATTRSTAGGPGVGHVGRVLRGMMVEFGGSEVLDLLFVRPFCLAAGYQLAGPGGALAGKVAADVVFYAPVVAVFEWRIARRRCGWPSLPGQPRVCSCRRCRPTTRAW